MYVIFPAEEIVYYTYGLRIVTPDSVTRVNQTDQTNSNQQSSVVICDTTSVPSSTIHSTTNPSQSLIQVTPLSSDQFIDSNNDRKGISRSSATNSSSSQTCSVRDFKDESIKCSYPNVKDIIKPIRPSRKKQKTQLINEQLKSDQDFFERAKSRPRFNTVEFNQLRVTNDKANFLLTKSAPNTPVANRKQSQFIAAPKIYKSFETERQHISTVHLSPSDHTVKERSPIRQWNFSVGKRANSVSGSFNRKQQHQQKHNLASTSADFDSLFLTSDCGNSRIHTHSPSVSPTTSPEKSPIRKKSFFFTQLTRNRKKSGSDNSYQLDNITNINSNQLTTAQSLSAGVSSVDYQYNFKMALAQQQQQQQQQYGGTLRELTHSSFNEPLKSHNSVTFKLVKTVSDFTQQLSQIYEQHAEQLQLLVESFRKRNGELRKERPACPSSLFQAWETLLQEVEIDSQNHSDIASILGRQVSRPLLERSFHRKIQSRKVFTHRESFETIISKTEEKLSKCRQDYKNAYLSYLSGPTTQTLSAYFDTHNAYVQQLHATNGMLEEYSKNTLPSLLKELEEIYIDLCSSIIDAVLQGAEVVSQRAIDQSKRYDALSVQCRNVSGPADLIQFARTLPQPAHNRPVLKRLFNPPQPPHSDTSPDGATTAGSNESGTTTDPYNEQNIPPPLKNELVIDRLASIQIKPSVDILKKEAIDLETQIKQIQDALDTLQRMQQRSLESNLYNKVNELAEDISVKRFDLHVAQVHLSAIQAQKELFTNKLESANDAIRDRKMSASSQGSMKNKWLKAFKSLKTPPAPSPRESEKDKKNGGGVSSRNIDSDIHTFQEYTYKKITPCDVCSQVLRGHTKQGLKCRSCKINVHVDCQDKATKCHTKSRLLRRQKSTSEIDTRLNDTTVEEESFEDNYFQYPKLNRQLSFKDSPIEVIYPSTELAPHSPRRQKLNLRMKSLSLDSPESTEHVQRRRHGGGVGVASTSGTTIDHSNSSSSRLQFHLKPIVNHHSKNIKTKSTPSSPVHNRRLLSARNMRMSSVELPDDNEKSLSSASTSPCPSPVGGKKSHRLLPTNLYVILYNYKSRQADELDLKAGYKVTVIDTSDNDWWKGKCLGKVGYFPSKYCTKLAAGEKPLQVTQNLRVAGGENNEGLLLLRDQIVIQIAEELDGMIMIRNGSNQTGYCPAMFLQEV